MPVLDRDELLQAIDREWDASCEHNRNPAACETCRAYDHVVDVVWALGDDGTPPPSIREWIAGLTDPQRPADPGPPCGQEHPQAAGWHCDVTDPHDTHEARLYGVARYRWPAGG